MEDENDVPKEITELKLYSEYNSIEQQLNLDRIELKTEKDLKIYLSKFSTADKIISCPKCHIKFSGQQYLRKHYASHLLNKPFICPKCYYKSSSILIHIQHLTKHSKEVGYSCQVCYEKFVDKNSLREHLSCHSIKEKTTLLSNSSSVVNEKFDQLVHKCLVYNFMLNKGIRVILNTTASIQVLNIPQGEGSESNTNTTEELTHGTYKFLFKNNHFDSIEEIIKLNENDPSDDNNLKSEIAFKNSNKNTSRVHPGELSSLNVIGPPFSILHPLHLSEDFSELEEEKIIYSLEANSDNDVFTCPSCDLKFKEKFAVEQHYFTHVLTRPFVCPTCFSRSEDVLHFLSHLMKHVNQIHMSCPKCQKEFNGVKELIDHKECGENVKRVAEEILGRRRRRFKLLVHYSLKRNKKL